MFFCQELRNESKPHSHDKFLKIHQGHAVLNFFGFASISTCFIDRKVIYLEISEAEFISIFRIFTC